MLAVVATEMVYFEQLSPIVKGLDHFTRIQVGSLNESPPR
jgi:hypothetical protein